LHDDRVEFIISAEGRQVLQACVCRFKLNCRPLTSKTFIPVIIAKAPVTFLQINVFIQNENPYAILLIIMHTD
jgi:hypothetical protein